MATRHYILALLLLTGCGSNTDNYSAPDNTDPAPDTSTPPAYSERFEIQADDSLVRDTATGLLWSRCGVGQSWNTFDGQCYGEATIMPHHEAPTYEGADWRIPNRNELLSLVCCPTCENYCDSDSPKIEIDSFPNTSVVKAYFSSSQTNADTVCHAVSYQSGNSLGFSCSSTVTTLHLRLVHGTPLAD